MDIKNEGQLPVDKFQGALAGCQLDFLLHYSRKIQERRIYYMILAEKIVKLRKGRGWSQEELAEQLDISRQSVSKWEGGLSVPELDKIIRMSEIF